MQRYRRKSQIAACFIVLFLALSSVAGAAQAAGIRVAPPNPDYLAFLEKQRENAGRVRSLAGDAERFTGYVPSKVDWSHLRSVSYSKPADGARNAAAFAAALPVSYDVRATLLPAVRDQEPFGTCWAFAAMAAAESNLIKTGLADRSVDLSEWYLAYYVYNDESAALPAHPLLDPDQPYYEQGGNDWMVTALLSRGTGPVFESDAPYPQSQDMVYAPQITPQRYRLHDALALGYAGHFDVALKGERIDLIKRTLMQYGALSIKIYQATDAAEEAEVFNPQTSAYYTGPDERDIDHLVSIVGWDDAYPVANFGGKDGASPLPDEDGAWIVRNSWGADWGDAGYYYVSYQDGSLSDGIAYRMTGAAADEKVYHYDPLGLEAFIDEAGGTGEGEGPETTSFFANVFRAERNEALHAVSFYSPMPNAAYEISIYTGVDANGSPDGGRLAQRFSGTLEAPGYCTVDLPSVVPVRAGRAFSVAVKVTMDYEYPIPTGHGTEAGAGKSWISKDGKNWSRLGDIALDNDDDDDDDIAVVCLKAFGTPTETASRDSSGCNALPLPTLLSLLPLGYVLKEAKRYRRF